MRTPVIKDSSHFLSLTKRGFTLLFLVVAQANAEEPQTLEELWADFPARDKATPLDIEVLKTWEENDVTLRLVRFNIGAFKGEMLKLAGFYAVPKGDMKGLPAFVVCHGGGPKNWAMNGYAAFCPNNGAQPWDNRFVGLPNTDYGSFNPAVRKPDNRDGKGRLAPGPNTIDPVLSPCNEAMYPSNVSSWDSSYYHSTDKAFAAENLTATSSKVDRFRNLRWDGGVYVERPKHWQKDARASK